MPDVTELKPSRAEVIRADLDSRIDDLPAAVDRDDIERLHLAVDDLYEHPKPSLTQELAGRIIGLFSEGVCVWADAVRSNYAKEYTDRYMAAAGGLLALVEGLAGGPLPGLPEVTAADVSEAIAAATPRLRQDIPA